MSIKNNNHRVTALWRIIRFGVTTVGLVCCLSGIWVAARVGSAGLYVKRSRNADAPLSLTERAVQLNPFDPEAHRQRALALRKEERLTECAEEHARAVVLRPNDYFLWLELGHARDRNHDADGALAAFNEAARLAPRYAQTRWYLGYGLLRARRNDEGFAELRRAVEIDPLLLTKFIDLTGEVYNGAPNSMLRRVSPKTDRERLALSRYFAKHDNVTEALDLFRATQVVPDNERRDLVQILLAGNHFAPAYTVWSRGRQVDPTVGAPDLFNGGFESQLTLEEPGFGWQIPREPKDSRISIDDGVKYEGGRSLHLEFAGPTGSSGRIISYLLLVEPGVRYRLNFFARTKEFVTAGVSFINIVDASDEDLGSLARSQSLPTGTNDWHDYSVEFMSPHSEAVSIDLVHQQCTSAPCSVFGHLWLDDFSLRKL